ncbi:hypothetical protein N1F89_08665 [Aquibium sp. A9E412]|uniref:hypothetical protein n=1 Tax=Aquibium sp. A9E412 TaxID=2976767 RepID=UPI0025B1BB39|nr:hypothetical protein [Aquibium sp. A9E412]MDN2566292.1 hypothetical protein [Aquibium sp. A9E412]
MSIHDQDRETFQTFVVQIRDALLDADLDCGCEARARSTLDRLVLESVHLQAELRLGEARGRLDAVRRLTAFLAELDELEPDEPDLSAFEEVALLFQEMSAAALAGAAAVRSAAALRGTAGRTAAADL